MSLRVLLVDDEKLARSRLRRLLGRRKDVEVVGEAEDGQAARGLIAGLKPDALFLDIKMPRISGFDLLRGLADPPFVVFTTAYDQFALQAFEENAVDYLLKPVTEEALDRALAKLARIAGREKRAGADLAPLLEALGKKGRMIKRFSVKVGATYLIVPDERVIFFEAREKYTHLHTEDRSYIVPFSLKDLENLVDAALFLRVHRAYIVNLDNIVSIHAWFGGRLLLKFKGGKEVVVSQSFAPEFRRRLHL
jgi:two-component system LytT family response regulator